MQAHLLPFEDVDEFDLFLERSQQLSFLSVQALDFGGEARVFGAQSVGALCTCVLHITRGRAVLVNLLQRSIQPVNK